MTDQLLQTTQYVFDNLSRKIETIAPDPDDYTAEGGTNGPLAAPTTYYGYDANGNLKYVTDPLNTAGAEDTSHTTWYFYDGLNRQTCVIDALAGLSASQGMANNPPRRPSNATVTTYDALGDVSTVTQSVNGATTQTTTYFYDDLGRKKQVNSPPPGDGAYPKTYLHLRSRRQRSLHGRCP